MSLQQIIKQNVEYSIEQDIVYPYYRYNIPEIANIITREDDDYIPLFMLSYFIPKFGITGDIINEETVNSFLNRTYLDEFVPMFNQYSSIVYNYLRLLDRNKGLSNSSLIPGINCISFKGNLTTLCSKILTIKPDLAYLGSKRYPGLMAGNFSVGIINNDSFNIKYATVYNSSLSFGSFNAKGNVYIPYFTLMINKNYITKFYLDLLLNRPIDTSKLKMYAVSSLTSNEFPYRVIKTYFNKVMLPLMNSENIEVEFTDNMARKLYSSPNVNNSVSPAKLKTTFKDLLKVKLQETTRAELLRIEELTDEMR